MVKKIVFVHPDLGIGGAERLIVDAGLALKQQGFEVKMFTAHHDPKHCFSETKDGTLSVVAVGDWLPRSLFGLCYALCAYIRMIYVALYLTMFSGEDYDVVICDQISACIPFLKLKSGKILFYCHFPDQLLSIRKSLLKKLYRGPIDWIEEMTTGMADCILVNSKFTAGTFKKTFKRLQHIEPKVLYPSLNFTAFDDVKSPSEDLVPHNSEVLFLSINRYERKKNLGLAILGLAELKEIISESDWKKVHLVMAGGYDERVTENKEHYFELRVLVEKYQLSKNVTFLRSFTDAEKCQLLNSCSCLLYTPSNEHFGIVPIEAMYMSRPVIAVNSGGPLETIVDGKTGYLCPPEAEEFAVAMERFVSDLTKTKSLGDAGHTRVLNEFSFQSFTVQLCNVVDQLIQSSSAGFKLSYLIIRTCFILIASIFTFFAIRDMLNL
ncbi:alpha-1,3/1,6-mannosyltransferase ALG2-like [Antedon mediterranea]|uniref:alpha-1,3/1,6-mannosyltransferase ALG2-like n=1 Tax=Antedon mediterranea TaxID=105859 RepID=UPI003AF5B608